MLLRRLRAAEAVGAMTVLLADKTGTLTENQLQIERIDGDRAKLALVVVIAAPLLLGLPAPFDPVQIVILELFMDVGASVASVSEPPAPGAVDHPPRDPARRFLDRTQLLAIALTAVALTAAVLPAFLIVHAQWGTRMGIAAAVAGWLIANVAVAWSLRARPGLSWRQNLAFPAWALVAVTTAAVLSCTPAGAALGTRPLTIEAAAITAAVAAAGVVIATAGRAAMSLQRRLCAATPQRRFNCGLRPEHEDPEREASFEPGARGGARGPDGRAPDDSRTLSGKTWSAPVVDRFDVVAVGIEHKRAVVAV